MNATVRLIVSALVAMITYSAWTYWANSLVTDDAMVLWRAAVTQGLLSGTITLLFTLGLEGVVKRFGGNCLSLMFITPILCGVHSRTPQNLAIFRTFSAALDLSATRLNGTRIPGTVLAPLAPLAVQSALAIGVHVLNQTPNLWLTVAPSILFTAIYGYVYTFTLLRENKAENAEAKSPEAAGLESGA